MRVRLPGDLEHEDAVGALRRLVRPPTTTSNNGDPDADLRPRGIPAPLSCGYCGTDLGDIETAPEGGTAPVATCHLCGRQSHH